MDGSAVLVCWRDDQIIKVGFALMDGVFLFFFPSLFLLRPPLPHTSSVVFFQPLPILLDNMPYPEEAEGFQVDSPDTYTNFNRRFVRPRLFLFSAFDARRLIILSRAVQVEALWRLWYVEVVSDTLEMIPLTNP